LGQMLPWDGRVWLNPPYSLKLLQTFMRRMADHNHGTALIFAKTETRVFFETVWNRASAVLFIRGRLSFHTSDGVTAENAPAPSVLVAYGVDDADILSARPIEGFFMPLRVPRNWLIEAHRDASWMEAVDEFFQGRDGCVTLPELYEAFSNHPKARRNAHYREKIRQILQRGRYVNVSKGVWQRRSA
jgi:hypothetical protein